MEQVNVPVIGRRTLAGSDETTHKKLNELLGKLIERKRVAAGISQESLAQEAGISRTYLSDIERGLRNISVFTLYKLAKGLKITASILVGEAEEQLTEALVETP
jgi:transcriptional regulator with XRE-family HTH domain